MTCNSQDDSLDSRIAMGSRMIPHASSAIGCARQLSLMIAFVSLFALLCVLIGMALASSG